MGLSEDIRRQLIESFKAEQREHIEKISQGLLVLEKDPDETARQSTLNEIFREAHSLKGAARSVGLGMIESVSHGLEDVLLHLREGYLLFTPDVFDLIYQGLDAVELLMEQLDQGQSTPPAQVLNLMTRFEEVTTAAKAKSAAARQPTQATKLPDGTVPPNHRARKDRSRSETQPVITPPPASTAPSQIETIRVSVEKLDTLMAQSSELLGAKIRAEQRLSEIQDLRKFAADWDKTWLSLRRTYSHMLRRADQSSGSDDLSLRERDLLALMKFMLYNQDQLRNLSSQANVLYRQVANDTLRLSLIIDELQNEVKRVRMLPLSTITTTFHRMMRDLARDQSKDIDFSIKGSEIELDKRVLEAIKDPLMHILRNATDHGVEVPGERMSQGKPATGTITLTAVQHGSNVVITVADDGAGLDIDAIRQRAIEKGLIDAAEANTINQASIADLIFTSGLSTSKAITDISGRGVGLDVVRQNIADLQGTLDVQSKLGEGTQFIMTLPLTLASSHALLVEVNLQTFALPLSTVERMMYISQDELTSIGGSPAIIYDDKPVALIDLANLLEIPRTHETRPDRLLLVVIAVAEKHLGLIIDELKGEQEIVVKGLGGQLKRIGGIAGASILGSGEVILVLHPADLVKLAARNGGVTAKPNKAASRDIHMESPTTKTVLVVDDSITTRTLEKNILEAAGYQVKVATNGEEALSLLYTAAIDKPQIIVSDVNMPRIDGFELTSQLKQDHNYADIPVILVTSLDSPADKARGIAVGADAYIVKSSFDQSNLLDTIEQLIL